VTVLHQGEGEAGPGERRPVPLRGEKIGTFPGAALSKKKVLGKGRRKQRKYEVTKFNKKNKRG